MVLGSRGQKGTGSRIRNTGFQGLCEGRVDLLLRLTEMTPTTVHPPPPPPLDDYGMIPTSPPPRAAPGIQ
jgi:hypothetical protein